MGMSLCVKCIYFCYIYCCFNIVFNILLKFLKILFWWWF